MKRVLAVLALALMLMTMGSPIGSVDAGPAPAGQVVQLEAAPTAPDVAPVQSNHVGWHTDTWCDSGWWLWHRYYAYTSSHSSIGQQSFGSYGRCWF